MHTMPAKGGFGSAMTTVKCGCLSHIGGKIQEVADENDLRIVHEFCGHGLGAILHMYPLV